MSIYSIPPLITAITFFSFGLFVFIKNRQKVGLSFLFLSIAVFWWQLSWFFLFNTTDRNLAWFIVRIGYTGLVFLPIWFNAFVISFANNYRKTNKLHYLIAVVFIICIWTTKLFVRGCYEYFFGFYPKANWMHIVYLVWTTYLLSLPHYYIYKDIYKKTPSSITKNRIRFFIIASAIYVLAVIDYLVNYGYEFYPFGFIFILTGLSLYVYAIIKHKLMDIDLAWRYGIEKIISFILNIGIIFGIGFFLLKFLANYLVVLIIAILSFISVPYLKSIFKKNMHSLLMKKYKTVWNKLQAIATDNTIHYEIKHIVKIIIKDVPDILIVNDPIYYQLVEGQHKFISYQFTGNSLKILTSENILVQRLNEQKAIIYKEFLGNSKEDEQLKVFMTDNNINFTFPIFFNSELVGIIAYGSKKNNSIYHQEEIDLLKDIFKKAEEQICNVLYLKYMSSHHAEEVLTKYKSTHQIQLLNAVKHLGSIRTLDELSNQITVLTNRYLNASYTHVYLYDEEDLGYVNTSIKNENNDKFFEDYEHIKENNYLIKYLRYRKEVFICSEINEWAKTTQLPELVEVSNFCVNLKAALIVPLIDVTLLGFIVVGEPRHKNEFYSENSLMMLAFIADRAEITISNILVREKAERDELTGIHNKAYLNNRTRIEVANCIKQGMPLSYLIMDADDFKWFNDNKSYAAGNEVLKAIVNAVKGVVRPTDEFCRWGGEEFILLILGADIKGGAVAGDKILNTIRNNSRIKQLEKEYGRKISVSIGLACFHPEKPITEFTNEDISRVSAALFMRSGVALKQAKKNGKDQMFESKSFKLGEEGSDKDIFPIKALIITNDKQYEQMSIHGVNITVVRSIEEAAIITKKYDISIVDIKNEKEDVESIINMLKNSSRDLVLGIISSNVNHREIAQKKGARFFLSPMEKDSLEEWAERLKKNL